VNGGGGSSGEGRRTYGPLWRLLGSLVGLTFGLLFFLLLFFFVLFISFTCFATVSSRLIDFDEGSTTHHLKKSKGSRGKDSSCNLVRKDSSCNWARECGEQRTSRPREKRHTLKSRGERT
jgi:hypothetical protein